MQEFVIVSNRLPLKVSHNKLTPSDGGLASALGSACNTDSFIWIGSLGESVDEKFLDQLPQYCQHVQMPSEVFKKFYEGYSNSVLWPCFHDRLDLMQFSEKDWLAYIEANFAFAHSVCKSSGEDTPIWVHDYHLILLPLLLKFYQPERKVSFFLHIPWPPPEVARLTPHLAELVRALAKSDIICVHTKEYADNMQAFYDEVNDIQGNDRKKLPLKVLPIGIDPAKFSCPEYSVELTWNKQPYKLQDNCIIGVDRLDYTKGVDRKIEIFAEFLELNPLWKKKVSLCQLLIPSRENVRAYHLHKNEVFQMADYVNSKFGTDDWKPIDLLYGNMDTESLRRFYSKGSFCWVASRKDGMNLVSLEYIAAQRAENPGLLILSDRTGCAQHLPGALSFQGNSDTHAYKILCQALKMSKEEKLVRYKRNIQWIRQNNVNNWVRQNLELLIPDYTNNIKKTVSYAEPETITAG